MSISSYPVRRHAPELSKEVDCECKWDGSISPTGLEKSFPSNVCVDNQGPVRSNGVGSYPMKIPKSMDRESVLSCIEQRLLIHITQEGCSGLSHL